MGASAADLAVAIADEIEKQEKVGWHWSVVASLDDDSYMPTNVTV